MPRRPKAKNTLSAGERAALYEAAMAERRGDRSSENTDTDKGAVVQNDTVSDDVKGIDEIKNQAKAHPEKNLPKPNSATVKVDFGFHVGDIKPFHSMCNGPVSYGADISGLFSEIGVPYVRFSEADTASSVCAVDISGIFKNSALDPMDEKSYDFSCADRYVRAAYNSGARVIFRLGESLDMMNPSELYGKRAIMDPDTLTIVCINIIKHYNDYFADGFAYGISHVEITNVAGGDISLEAEAYKRISGGLRIFDDDLSVGIGLGAYSERQARELLRLCGRNRAAIDFVTVSSFNSSPIQAREDIHNVIVALRQCGFDRADVFVGAWNIFDIDRSSNVAPRDVGGIVSAMSAEKKKDTFEVQSSIKGAAYCASFMLMLNEINDVSLACYYDAQPAVSYFCGIADRYGNPQKPFYSFKTYGELYRAKNSVFCRVEQPVGFAHTGIYALAASNDSGECYVMISSYNGCGVVDLRLDSIPDNIYTADIYMIDGVKDLALGDSIQISGMKKRLLLNLSEYSVVLIKLY